MDDFPWEDNLFERKVESDLKDLLKTLVAFANSVKPGHTATLRIGERDDGSAMGVTNPDKIQKTIRAECDKIYPAINWRSTVYEKEGKKCVRVEVEYSGETPHFGGSAWIRKGSETIKSSDEIFQRLIDLRSGKVRELSTWINKEVTVKADYTNVQPPRESGLSGGIRYIFLPRWPVNQDTIAIILSVNSFWVTFQKKDDGKKQSEPLQKLTLNFDDKRNQLEVIVYP